jgi:hypothetical protein
VNSGDLACPEAGSDVILEAESSYDIEMINEYDPITISASLEQEQPIQHITHSAGISGTIVSNQSQPTASASFTLYKYLL